jgi:hypothetical protein
MSLQISIRIKKSGSLANADTTPTLADAAAAFGIKRVSDSVVVVAAATAMTAQSTGVYVYVFADAVAGVTYLWSAKAIIDGVTYYKEETVTAPAESSATSYLTTAEADTIAATLPASTAWAAASSDVKARSLELASMRFDNARRYQGRKYDGNQFLEFPRLPYDGGSLLSAYQYPLSSQPPQVWDWDSTADEAIVPLMVKRAVFLEAVSIVIGDRDRIVNSIANGIVSQTTGSLSETYARLPNTASGLPALCADAEMISHKYKLRSGAML